MNALVRVVRLDDLAHPFFNPLEIIFREGLLAIEVVIEAGLGGRADSRVRVREKFGDRSGQNVSRRMAVNLQPLGRGWSNELDRRVLLDRSRKVHQAAVQLGRQRVRRQPWPDRLGHLQRRCPLRKFLHCLVRECDLNVRHSSLTSQVRKYDL